VRKTRLVVALGLIMALGVAAIAYADGASENTAFVDGKFKPTKLDKKKYKPINFFVGVRTTGPIPGENPEAEYISFGKNLKWKGNAAPTCSAPIEFQSTDAAKGACPPGSVLGSGDASIELPGGLVYHGITVTAFNGPGKNQVRLHTYDPRLAGATPTVFGRIVKSNQGAKFGQALVVDDAPDVAGDAGKITEFNSTIKKKSGVALGRCKAKKFLWNRIVTYDDGTKENVTLQEKCKRK
jgi:hypothetical protein